tara:strand:- start:2370 stop:2582 length:213 start_codon:yes stop_codon:yes gene_type:complete
LKVFFNFFQVFLNFFNFFSTFLISMTFCLMRDRSVATGRIPREETAEIHDEITDHQECHAREDGEEDNTE